MGAEKNTQLIEQVTAALNEQGFLFQIRVRENITNQLAADRNLVHFWKFEASEYPVTSTDETQTRIDLVLRHNDVPGLHLCLECKRANPQFKNWIFFDHKQGAGRKNDCSVSLETIQGKNQNIPMAYQEEHLLCPTRDHEFSVFTCYLESKIAKDGKVSHTETIEDAFRQVIRGQTGLLQKLKDFRVKLPLRSIPVVVTTARLFKAEFDVANVSLTTGSIESKNLQLTPIEYCAVNYNSDDSLAIRPAMIPSEGTIVQDLKNWKVRSVFVVQSNAISKFLSKSSDLGTYGLDY